MNTTKEQQKTLKLSAIAVVTVIASGVAAYLIAPDNQMGKLIKFTVPLLTGLIVGGRIYFRQLKLLEAKLGK